MYILFNVQAAGPVFFAVAKFDGLSKSTQSNAAAITTVLSVVVEPFVKGFCYNAGRDLDLGWIGNMCLIIFNS